VLERYIIVERIAVGGMGEVFVARQHGVGNFRRTVVLKKLLPDAEGSDEAAERMLDEARINGALRHDNVVSIIEVGTATGERGELPWLALEYVHGENAGTLRTRAAKREMIIPLEVALRITADCARGLQHAHDAKDVNGRPLHIIHRDIAPKNIFVRDDGVSKVGDFGIARADARLSHTATGAVAGTLTYMSPEQLTSKTLTPASDQFALGIVCWELLTGRRLFKGDGPIETAEKILSGNTRAPSRYRSDVPAGLDAVVLRMLEQDPGKRFANIADVADAIEHLVPTASMTLGRAAVAAFVEELAGDQLRERQQRIEEGAEQTTRADRPPMWDLTGSAGKQPGSGAITGSSKVPNDTSGEPTRRDAPASAPLTMITGGPPPPQPSRRWQLTAAVLGVALLVAIPTAIMITRDRDDPDRQMREHLHRAARIKPLSFREVVIVDGVAAGLSIDVATPLADDLTTLMKERLALVVAHWDLPPAKRELNKVAARTAERAIIDRTHQRLAALGNDHAELHTDLMDIWQYDSSVPIRFLPPLTLEQIQARVYPNGIEMMHDTRAERWDQVALLAKRAGVDPAAVRARLEPLVQEREQLLERFGVAPMAELASLEQQAEAVVTRGVSALQGVVDGDVAESIVHVAFIRVPSSLRGEPEIDDHADAVSKPESQK
jgi:serine/threonine protein kinase